MSANFIEVGPFQPVISFPASDGRKFRKEWYAIYEWLEYSPALDRPFCFTCCAFGEFKRDTFQVTGFGNWKKATRRTKKAMMPGPNADSAQDHYKELHFSVLDNTVNEIRERFQENDMNTLTALNDIISSSTCTTEDLTFICHHFGFPEEETSAELSLFNAMSTGQASFDERLSLFKESKLVHSLVNAGNLFKLFLTVPMNSASCKINFSSLRRLKTYVRNTVSQERLSDIAVLNIERNIHVDLDKTVNRFDAMPGGRRLALH